MKTLFTKQTTFKTNVRPLYLLVALLLGLLPAALQAQNDGPVNAAQSDPAWRAQYWNNRSLTGDPVLERDDAEINFDWGTGTPDPAIPVNRFSARWTRYVLFEAADYEFRVTSDDGIRVYIDDQLLISKWYDHGVRTWVVRKALTAGHHLLRVEYYEGVGAAVAKFTWQKAGGAPSAPPSEFVNWRAEYFNNRDLSGSPVTVRDDANLNFDWGAGSPIPGTVNQDNFSARWTRTLVFEPGNYRFRVTVDDGVRVFVNNARIIDEWRTQATRTYESEIYLPGGPIPLRVEYFEFDSSATIRVSWERVGAVGATATWTPVPGSAPTATPTPITWSPGPINNPTDPFSPGSGSDPAWTGQYYNNQELSGTAVFTRADGDINFDFGNDSPGSGVGVDGFSVRWSRTLVFPAGRYRFTTETDDGVRLYINNSLVIDQWREQTRASYSVDRDLNGSMAIRMEFFEKSGSAFAKLSIGNVRTQRVGNLITCVPPQPKNYAWIWIYRLDGNNQWYRISRGIGSINASGYLKIDGLPVDVGRFGDKGEPYRIEQVIDSKVVRSVGNYQAGEPTFLLLPERDNSTPWGCGR